MSRYNSNYGSHDQLQDLRKLNMEVMRERDALQREVQRLHICLEAEQWRIRTLTDQICQLEEGTL